MNPARKYPPIGKCPGSHGAGHRFCGDCGEQLMWKCDCGHWTTKTWRFCVECGHDHGTPAVSA